MIRNNKVQIFKEYKYINKDNHNKNLMNLYNHLY